MKHPKKSTKQKNLTSNTFVRAGVLMYSYYRSPKNERLSRGLESKSKRKIDFKFWFIIILCALAFFVPFKKIIRIHDNNSTQIKKSSFNKSKYSIDNPSSIWIVVNKKRPLSPINYAPGDLISVGNGQLIRSEAAKAFGLMVRDANLLGYNLVAESGYRSYETQMIAYESEVKNFGEVIADNESARPGHSEHQTGFAVDIGSNDCFEDCFGKTPVANWLLTNAYRYGFMLRYPSNKLDVTGYRNEPWHFRFVGVELSTQMHKESIETLEEFFGLPAAANY